MPRKKPIRKKRTKKRKYSVLDGIEKKFFTLILILLVFGIIMIFNATAIYAQGSLGNAYKLVLQQIAWVMLGLVGFVAVYNTPVDVIKRISFPIFIVSLLFLAVLALAGLFSSCDSSGIIFTPCINGAYRWFYLNPQPLPELPLLGVLSFQPSEFAKLAFVMYLALILEKNIRQKEDAFKVFLILTGLVSGLVLLQPNMSTAALVFMIGVAMFFVSGANLKRMFVALPAIFISGLVFILSSEYRRSRLLTFLRPAAEAGELSFGYHIKQIQIALGTGGFWGVGFGQSRQKFNYLPEVAGDSIFAIVGEELGFIGTSAFIIVFTYLMYRCYLIAKKCSDSYSRMIVVGVTAWLSFQFFINIAAMTRIIPLTGIPLPLVSYGGSSLVFSMIGLGLIAKFSSDDVK